MKPIMYLSITILSLSVILTIGFHSGVKSAEASVFDNSRKGFVMGFGAGPGAVNGDHSVPSSFVGLQTDLKIGAGISNHVLIHFTGKQFWIVEDDGAATLGNFLVGLTYYAKDNAPSLFVSGGTGLSHVAAVWDNGGGLVSGFGFFAGIGWELDPHWNVELNIIRSQFKTHIDDPTQRVRNVTLTINILGY